jgi:hypothetical protein
MAWSDHINQRTAYWGAPDLVDGQSRVGEAMGGLADDDCGPVSVLAVVTFDADEQDRVHEAMGGMCRSDDA